MDVGDFPCAAHAVQRHGFGGELVDIPVLVTARRAALRCDPGNILCAIGAAAQNRFVRVGRERAVGRQMMRGIFGFGQFGMARFIDHRFVIKQTRRRVCIAAMQGIMKRRYDENRFALCCGRLLRSGLRRAAGDERGQCRGGPERARARYASKNYGHGFGLRFYHGNIPQRAINPPSMTNSMPVT